MSWQALGEQAFILRGAALPATPNEVYCFDVGEAQALGRLRVTTANTLIASYTPVEQAFRNLAVRMFTNT